MDHPPPIDELQRGLKRSSERSRAFYPRKRALLACEVCRRRKSKCDVEKPACGSCRELGIECVYRDTRSDYSTYDPASLQILAKIGRVEELLENQEAHISGLLPALLAAQRPFSPSLSDGHTNEPSQAPTCSTPQFLPGPHGSHSYEPQEEAALLLESLEFSEGSTGKCEDLLEWPIFEGRFPRSEVETLIFNPDLARDDSQGLSSTVEADPDRRLTRGCGIQEGDALRLIQRFLAHVHIKNPILDADDIQRLAKDVMEHGFKWDAPSCLVLIASALGCLSSPYRLEYVTADLLQGEPPCSSVDDARDYSTAENYYVASQKRISLLKHSILAAQCYFLTGVYEMYSLRPLRAWSTFNRACLTLQVYLKTKRRPTDPVNERLERRLYWSCLKSECEIRMEICLPPSGLAKINYPDEFPTPPSGSPTRVDDSVRDRAAGHGLENDPSMLTAELEKSWGYYLSDIAVRRIANRVMNTFYRGSPSSWLSMPLERMIRMAEELELQLTQWHSHIPKLVAAPDLSSPTPESEELCSLLQLRLFEFRERIYRPFLYLAIHQPLCRKDDDVIKPYAERCLSACLQNTLRGSYRHRHHGTWYQNRKIFAESLLILAAVKSGRVSVPSVWRDAINTTIWGLNFWEREAPDLQRARIILRAISDTIDGPQ